MIEYARNAMDTSLLTIGNAHLTVASLGYIMVVVILLFLLTKRIQRWTMHQLEVRRHVDAGVSQAVTALVRYLIISLGIVVILQSIGIDLSTLTVIGGGLGVGVGFGLQSIANNIVSGLIILIERPIKAGDRIEIGSITGDVLRIALRSTVVRTNDNIDIIVPNSEFISSRVTNWSYIDRDVRFSFPVGVSYNADPDEVRGVLLQIAAEHPGILKTPEPEVIMEEFGESSLNFVLRVWSRDYITHPLTLRSELNMRIHKRFKSLGIQIPYPQRDIHLIGAAV